MKAPRFAYARPATVAETLDLLGRHGEDCRLLAGGQSLMPMLNLRIASPGVLIDLNFVSGLAGIAVTRDCIRIGALTRHCEVEQSPEIAEHLPLLAQAMPHIAHPAIRNRGTFGGSCALADPAAELPACALALDATFHVASTAGERRIPAADFFRGLYTTALRPNEMLVAAEFPRVDKRHSAALAEMARRHGDYAMVGVAVAAHGAGARNRFSDLRIVLFGVGDRPLRVSGAESILSGRDVNAAAIAEAIGTIDGDIEPRGDVHCSAAAKLHLGRVLVGRVLATLANPAPLH